MPIEAETGVERILSEEQRYKTRGPVVFQQVSMNFEKDRDHER